MLPWNVPFNEDLLSGVYSSPDMHLLRSTLPMFRSVPLPDLMKDLTWALDDGLLSESPTHTFLGRLFA